MNSPAAFKCFLITLDEPAQKNAIFLFSCGYCLAIYRFTVKLKNKK